MSPDIAKFPLGEQNYPHLKTTYLENVTLYNTCSKVKSDDINRTVWLRTSCLICFCITFPHLQNGGAKPKYR